MIIKKIVHLIVFLTLFISGLAFAQSKDAVIALGKLLQGFQTYQAKFDQVTVDANGAIKQRTYGRVMIKRPGGFRWESDTPTKQIVIIDGKTLWTYDVDLQQATQRSLDQKANINSASLLSGSVSDLTNQFNVVALSERPQTFLLTPKQASNVSFKSVELQFNKRQLTRMKIVNSLDETSIFTFNHIRLNQPLSSRLFQFKPPPGVDVVSQ